MAPHRRPRGRHNPIRPPVHRTTRRWVNQNHRIEPPSVACGPSSVGRVDVGVVISVTSPPRAGCSRPCGARPVSSVTHPPTWRPGRSSARRRSGGPPGIGLPPTKASGHRVATARPWTGDPPPTASTSTGFPLGAGAGGALVRWSGRLYETMAAARGTTDPPAAVPLGAPAVGRRLARGRGDDARVDQAGRPRGGRRRPGGGPPSSAEAACSATRSAAGSVARSPTSNTPWVARTGSPTARTWRAG